MSNTSIGSTNNLLQTPGGGVFQNREPSVNTYEQISNPAMPSVSPMTNMKSDKFSAGNWQMGNSMTKSQVGDKKRSSSLLTSNSNTGSITQNLRNNQGQPNRLTPFAGITRSLTPGQQATPQSSQGTPLT